MAIDLPHGYLQKAIGCLPVAIRPLKKIGKKQQSRKSSDVSARGVGFEAHNPLEMLDKPSTELNH
jgi:hypothetical protein